MDAILLGWLVILSMVAGAILAIGIIWTLEG